MLYSTSAARVGAVLRGGCSKGVSARAMPDPIETIRACLASPLPPGYRNPGPRVEHLLAPREDFVSTLVAEGLQLPQDVVAGLIEIGAVYCCPVPPALPGSLACEPSSGARQAALKQHGNDVGQWVIAAVVGCGCCSSVVFLCWPMGLFRSSAHGARRTSSKPLMPSRLPKPPLTLPVPLSRPACRRLAVPPGLVWRRPAPTCACTPMSSASPRPVARTGRRACWPSPTSMSLSTNPAASRSPSPWTMRARV
ncbi:hypothetical protein ACKKBG_A13370 [Auxenochlorella protothecoides x Auxenochlorella symbiontica]